MKCFEVTKVTKAGYYDNTKRTDYSYMKCFEVTKVTKAGYYDNTQCSYVQLYYQLLKLLRLLRLVTLTTQNVHTKAI